jgi:hypothetical protein
MNKAFLYILFFPIVLLACNKNDKFTTEISGIEFSTDSLIFDTVFSGIGSATKYFKIYNRSSENIEISEIKLAKGNASKYKINIDGKPSDFETNIRINKKDSLYIFVNVSINTNQDALLEQDSIVFSTSNEIKDIKLLAWGQDVHLINGEIIGTTTWQNDKPYLVYNSMLVDTNQMLRIDPGTKIYFHRGSRMYVAGTLEINGTFEQPVSLQGDRLEEMYSDVPGQWDGIWLMNGSKHNNFNFVNLKNAVVGIQIDTLADINIPTLSISNSRIEHMSFAGIYAQGTTLFASNCLIADCGYYLVGLTIGGSYDFYQCTFANYWQNSFRETPSLLLNNYYTYQNQPIIRNITHAGFYNCLIWGNRDNEIFIDAYANQGVLNYVFDHCLMKYTSDSKLNANFLNSCLNNQDPLFLDYEKYDYRIDALSPAINKASRLSVDAYPVLLNLDLLQHSRILDVAPDIGVYEYITK